MLLAIINSTTNGRPISKILSGMILSSLGHIRLMGLFTPVISDNTTQNGYGNKYYLGE